MSFRSPLQHLSPARSYSLKGKVQVAFEEGDDDAFMFSAKSTKHVYHQQRQKTGKTRPPQHVVVILAVLVFITQFGSSLSDLPSVQLLQQIICGDHYDVAPGNLDDEASCLAHPIQEQLNIISIGALIFGYLPGIIVAIPYGSLADRRGRKPVLGLCILGMILSQLIWIATAWNQAHWDLRYVWLSALPLLIGGGGTVVEAMVFAIVADVAPEAKRALYFQIEICAVLLAEAIAPFVASALMAHSVWLPILISPAIMSLGGLCIGLLPETLDRTQKPSDKTRRKITPTIFPAPALSAPLYDYTARAAKPQSRWSRSYDSVRSAMRLVGNREILLLIPSASLTIPVATVTIGIMLRYMPARFSWTLEQTGMVLGVRTGISIFVLLVFLPVLSSSLLAQHDGRRRDMVLARTSAALLVLGQLVFAVAPNAIAAAAGLAVLTLGTGLPSLCRAVLTRLVDRGSVGRLFGVLAACEMAGYLGCGVGFGAVFHAGLVRGLGQDGTLLHEGWLALVFYVATVVYVCCASLLWLVRKGFGRDGADVASLHSAASVASSLHEVRILADGRVTRKHPSLENVSVAI